MASGFNSSRQSGKDWQSDVQKARENSCRKVFAEGARQRLTDFGEDLLVGIRRLEPAVGVLRTFDQGTGRLTRQQA